MPVQAEQIYRDHDTIVDLLIAALIARIPDAHTDEDGIIRLLFEVFAGEIEGTYLANELLRNDIFIQLASAQALDQHGEMFGRVRLPGTTSTGTLRFTGGGGTFIPQGTQVAANPGTDDILYFDTSADATVPSPGIPTAPTLADGGAGGLTAGTYEHVVTFQTAAGETVPGAASAPLVLGASKQISITAIPLGGAGTVGRRIYRRKDGGDYKLVTTIANNTATTFTDNVADGSLGAAPLAVSTAEAIAVAAVSDDVGLAYNVIVGAVNEIVDIPAGVSGVTNTTTFTGGSDPEETEAYRSKLLDFVRSPKSGSKVDMETWAEEISGVDNATAFPNDNLGTPQAGHVTVRIVGPNGAVPSGAVIAAVQAFLDAQDVSNIVVHVTTFTAVPTNVTVVVTPATGFILADVSASVTQAITDYINAVPVGGTLYRSGLIDAIYGLNGVADVTVTTPASNVTSTATQKITPGTISVT
jgi:uncharacterized phage protein gp47/JayE